MGAPALDMILASNRLTDSIGSLSNVRVLPSASVSPSQSGPGLPSLCGLISTLSCTQPHIFSVCP